MLVVRLPTKAELSISPFSPEMLSLTLTVKLTLPSVLGSALNFQVTLLSVVSHVPPLSAESKVVLAGTVSVTVISAGV